MVYSLLKSVSLIPKVREEKPTGTGELRFVEKNYC